MLCDFVTMMRVIPVFGKQGHNLKLDALRIHFI